jgi:hypothetical protein
MTPDPNTLMAVNASDCTSDALLNNQALQRKSVRDESATFAAQATAIPLSFDSLIASRLHMRKPGANRQAPSPDGMILVSTISEVEAVAGSIEFVPHPYETVPARSPESGWTYNDEVDHKTG